VRIWVRGYTSYDVRTCDKLLDIVMIVVGLRETCSSRLWPLKNAERFGGGRCHSQSDDPEPLLLINPEVLPPPGAADCLALHISSGYYYKCNKPSFTVGDTQSMILGLSKVEGLTDWRATSNQGLLLPLGLSLDKVFVHRSVSRASTNPAPCGLRRSRAN
jgi:hypothetical protein